MIMSHILIQHYLTDEDKEIIIDCLKNDFPVSMMIGSDNSSAQPQSAQPEITLEEVKEYCRKRGYVLLTSEVFYSLKQEYQRGKNDGYTQGFRDATELSKANNNVTERSKDEDYRWNGGGNY